MSTVEQNLQIASDLSKTPERDFTKRSIDRSVKLAQLDRMVITNDLQMGLLENQRSVAAINKQNEQAVQALLDERAYCRAGADPNKATGDSMPDKEEDETQISNNLSDSFHGDTIIHNYYGATPSEQSGGVLAGSTSPQRPVVQAVKKSLFRKSLPLILSGAGLVGLGGLGGAGITWLSGLANQSDTTQTREVDPGSAAAEITLYYNDPVKGLVPISGAADKEGATIHE